MSWNLCNITLNVKGTNTKTLYKKKIGIALPIITRYRPSGGITTYF